MIHLGNLNEREIIYLKIRDEINWSDDLPISNWLVFTIADEEDSELLINAVPICLDKLVSYTCSAGQLADFGERLFDVEIVERAIAQEAETGRPYDYESSPMTTMHENFSEGFWFAITTAYDEQAKINKLVCLDFTSYGVKKSLIELVEKINKGWLPSDDEYEEPVYDK